MSLSDAVRDQLPGVLADLEALVAIESVGADRARSGEVERSAEKVAELLRGVGSRGARLGTPGPDVSVEGVEGGASAVIARFPAPDGMPTVCLYAHHDVQPEGDPALWKSPPFVATTIGKRMFGRGSSDDKGGFAMHLAALRAFDGKPPVGVTLFIEGEEEIGSPSLDELLKTYRSELAADVFVIADSGNWAVGEPAFTTTLRGFADCVVEVRTLDHALHSGEFGGVVPDALTTMCRLLATLHDEHGDVAVEGLTCGEAPTNDYTDDQLRADTGILDGVEWVGTGSFTERMWRKPALVVIALDATPVDKASNTLAPSARAKINLRIAPGEDAATALQKLTDHLIDHAPWGAQVTIIDTEIGEPSTIDFSGPYAAAAQQAFTKAWGKEPVLMGQGGSIPMVATFAEAFPEATILVTAVSDPDSRPHGPNESLHLGDFEAACISETLMLAAFAELTSPTS